MTGASGGGAVSLDANTFQPLRPFLNCISQPYSLLCTLFLGGHTQIPNYTFVNLKSPNAAHLFFYICFIVHDGEP